MPYRLYSREADWVIPITACFAATTRYEHASSHTKEARTISAPQPKRSHPCYARDIDDRPPSLRRHKWLSFSLTQWNTPLALTSMIRLQSLYPISDLDSPLRGLREVVARPGNLP